MKCGTPYPKSTYQDCQLNLGHPGQHEYLGTKWPRLVPNELDPDIADLLEATMPPRTWGVDERSYPIVVTETITRIVWVDAESEDKALAYWADDFADLDLQSSYILDGDLEFQRPDQWQRQEAMSAARHGRPKLGPQVACPGCDALAFRREWLHNPYRKCHGPITWRTTALGKPRRDFQTTPQYDAARQAVAS